jgi:DNA-binding NarL/FixJ family response regulator
MRVALDPGRRETRVANWPGEGGRSASCGCCPRLPVPGIDETESFVKILIADDHELFRAGIQRILRDVLGEVAIVEAGDLDSARKVVAEHDDLDLVLLDLNMPGMEGFRSVRRLSDEASSALLVVVSASESQEDIRSAIRCGAAGFIPKASSAAVLIAALRLILAGGVYVPPILIDDGIVAGEHGAAAPVTPREYDVLKFLVRGKSNKEIARELAVSMSAVKLHVSAVLRKLDVNNRTEAAVVAERLGIVHPSKRETPFST